MARRSEQLQLITESPSDPALTCKGIFSQNYLRQHFAKSEDCPQSNDARELYEAVKTRWHDNLPGLGKRQEAYTRTAFLDPLLSELGWFFIPEAELPRGVTLKKPDYCLFSTLEARQNAAAQSDTVQVFRFAESALEAKKWGHSLDKVSEKDTPGKFPSQQIQDYLRHAKDATGARLFNWAILTNGAIWRLYCEQAPNDAYFQFELASDASFCSLEDFRLFVGLFRPIAFSRNSEGACLLDQIREESLTRQAQLELSLRKRIFDVLEDLASGFRDYAANDIKPG
jgi:hypothetical protein